MPSLAVAARPLESMQGSIEWPGRRTGIPPAMGRRSERFGPQPPTASCFGQPEIPLVIKRSSRSAKVAGIVNKGGHDELVTQATRRPLDRERGARRLDRRLGAGRLRVGWGLGLRPPAPARRTHALG